MNNNFTMIEDNEKIPFTAGYHILSSVDIPQWIVKFRRAGMESYTKNFASFCFNSRIKDFIKDDDFELKPVDVFPSLDSLLKYRLLDIEAYTLVLINGKYSPDLSYEDELPFSVFSDSIDFSLRDDSEFLNQKLVLDDNSFIALNSAYLSDGIVLEIADGEKLSKPIHIISIITTQNEKIFFNPRVFVKVGDNVNVDIIESNLSFDCEKYFENRVSQFVIGKNSVVNDYKITDVSFDSLFVENNIFNLDDNAEFNQVSFNSRFGNYFIKNISYIEKNASFKSFSSFEAKKNSMLDCDCILNHIGDMGESDVRLFSVALDESDVSFKTEVNTKSCLNGVKTSQESRVLLMSDKAKARIKPFQKIASEKVKAFHGAVISGITSAELFFLQTRGISEDNAKLLLMKACLANVLQNIKDVKIYDEFFKLIWL